jgi:hypothetical protein
VAVRVAARSPRLAEGEFEPQRYEHIFSAQLVDRGAAKGEQSGVDPFAQNVEHVLDTALAVRGQPQR